MTETKIEKEDTDWLNDIKKSRDITQEILRFGVNQEQIKSITSQQLIPKLFKKSDVCDLVELLIDKRASSLTGHVFTIGGV